MSRLLSTLDALLGAEWIPMQTAAADEQDSSSWRAGRWLLPAISAASLCGALSAAALPGLLFVLALNPEISLILDAVLAGVVVGLQLYCAAAAGERSASAWAVRWLNSAAGRDAPDQSSIAWVGVPGCLSRRGGWIEGPMEADVPEGAAPPDETLARPLIRPQAVCISMVLLVATALLALLLWLQLQNRDPVRSAFYVLVIFAALFTLLPIACLLPQYRPALRKCDRHDRRGPLQYSFQSLLEVWNSQQAGAWIREESGDRAPESVSEPTRPTPGFILSDGESAWRFSKWLDRVVLCGQICMIVPMPGLVIGGLLRTDLRISPDALYPLTAALIWFGWNALQHTHAERRLHRAVGSALPGCYGAPVPSFTVWPSDRGLERAGRRTLLWRDIRCVGETSNAAGGAQMRLHLQRKGARPANRLEIILITVCLLCGAAVLYNSLRAGVAPAASAGSILSLLVATVAAVSGIAGAAILLFDSIPQRDQCVARLTLTCPGVASEQGNAISQSLLSTICHAQASPIHRLL